MDFEKEYRSHKTWLQDADNTTRNMEIPKNAFKELIIGDKVNDKRREELIGYAKALNAHIKILTASLDNGVIVVK